MKKFLSFAGIAAVVAVLIGVIAAHHKDADETAYY